MLAVVGERGSGKSTLMHILGCLDLPDAGEYQLQGEDVTQMRGDQLAALRNREIGFIFQSFNLIPDLNLADNVDVPLRYRGWSGAERRRAVGDMLDRVGLGSRSNYLPSQLSGGQQQRVAIARALAGKPRFLLADEPTGNLDSVSKRSMNLCRKASSFGSSRSGFQGNVEKTSPACSPAISTSSVRTTESVTGSIMWKVVPRPGSVVIRMVPPTSRAASSSPNSRTA